MKRLWLLVAASLVHPLIGCTSTPTQDDEEATELSPTAVAQIEELLAEKARRTPVQRKISSQLLYAASGRFNGAAGHPGEEITTAARTDARGRVLVDIRGDAAALRGRVQAVGGEIVNVSDFHGSARAWLDLGRVEELASSDSVRSIHPAFLAVGSRSDATHRAKLAAGARAQRVAALQAAIEAPPARLVSGAASVTGSGSRRSQGVAAHGVTRARKFYGESGAGVRVGVISDSDDFREEAIASGDLPAGTITIPGQDGRPGSGEGTAMMEIVHDVAPGAQLVFATGFTGPQTFADNIRRLRFEYDCDIIVDDLLYFAESPYQDDIIAQAVEDVVADGAVFLSSASNDGNFNDGTSGVWEGDFKDGGTLATLPSGYTVHNFGDKVISNRIEEEGIGRVALHWSDPGSISTPASANDYDLFVLDRNLRDIQAASTDLQDGEGMPFELADAGIGQRVVVVRKPDAAIRAIRLEVFRGQLGIATPGSTYGHNASKSAISVAAVDATSGDGGEFIAGPTTQVELFSSDGPRRVFYNRHGVAIRAGRFTFASNGGEVRNKPDVAGADGVDTTLPSGSGLNPFFGTSAAAPHIAGIAALIKSGAPFASSQLIRTLIANSTYDIEAVGPDRDSGKGITMAPLALRNAGIAPAVFLSVSSQQVTSNTDVVLPGSAVQVRLQLANEGGAVAGAVTATLRSASPFVNFTRSTVSYPTINPGATASSQNAFAFTVAPGLPCGVQLPLELSVNFTGKGTRPSILGLTAVQTGRPNPNFTTTSYNGPPVAIPDTASGPDGSPAIGVPLQIAATGSLHEVRFRIDGSACSTTVGSTTVGIDHPSTSDLAFGLFSPTGTLAELAQANGNNGDGNNFCQTAFVDGAPDSVFNALPDQAPFTGVFSPLTPLASFIGEEASGEWTFLILDSEQGDSDEGVASSGSVRAFSVLTRSGFVCTP